MCAFWRKECRRHTIRFICIKLSILINISVRTYILIYCCVYSHEYADRLHFYMHFHVRNRTHYLFLSHHNHFCRSEVYIFALLSIDTWNSNECENESNDELDFQNARNPRTDKLERKRSKRENERKINRFIFQITSMGIKTKSVFRSLECYYNLRCH